MKVSNIVQVAGGVYHSCALSSDGLLFCFGDNLFGQCGTRQSTLLGLSINAIPPSDLPYSRVDVGGEMILSVSAGDYHTCVVTENHRLKCFGKNSDGQLGLGDTNNRGHVAIEMGDKLPYVELGTDRTVKQVATGARHTCVILDNDKVKCFGDNEFGQLGLGDKKNRGDYNGSGEYEEHDEVNDMGDSLPYVDLGGHRAKQLALGDFHTCVLLDNNQIKCFGGNENGQLGLGDRENRGDDSTEMGNNLTYVNLGTNQTVAQVDAGGQHTCVLLHSRRIKCFGYNRFGQLGLGNDKDRGDEPNEMGDSLLHVDVGGDVKHVSAGYQHTCVFLMNDQIKCFGDNRWGQLGLGDSENRGDDQNEMGIQLQPVLFGASNIARSVFAGEDRTCVIMESSRVKCFGSNDHGQLGIGDRESRGDSINDMGDNLPFLELSIGRQVKQFVSYYMFNCALLENGHMKCFGENKDGSLGLGHSRKVDQVGNALPYVDVGTALTVQQVSVGDFFTCVLLKTSRLKCFGDNTHGQLGLGDDIHRGDSADEMGDKLPYVDLGTDRTVKQVATGARHTCVILDNDKVKCFGDNNFGQLGLGDTENRGDAYNGLGEYEEYEEVNEMGDSLPYVDLGGHRAKQLALGDFHTCVLLDNNQIKCFGGNENGQLGLGDRENRGDDSTEMGNNLTYVNLGTNQTVTQVDAGGQHTCVLLHSRRIKCFGYNQLGQLGLGDNKDRGDEPNEMGDSLLHVDVGGDVKHVSAGYQHTCVLLMDGQIKCFGDNGWGQLGLGDSENRGDDQNEMGNALPPVDVRSTYNAIDVVAGGQHTCVTLSSNHVKCFGANSFGELGLGDTVPRSSAHMWPIALGYGDKCVRGSKLTLSQLSCEDCPAGEHQPLNNQAACIPCPIGQYQDQTGSTSCKSCNPGTYRASVGASACIPCPAGQYTAKYGSIVCDQCPFAPQTTTVGEGNSNIQNCVSAPGYVAISGHNNTNKNSSLDFKILDCERLVGVDCRKPGATLENAPLKCGFWRANPLSFETIEKCSGGCIACMGGSTGTWSTNDFAESTKYCELGYIGPRCELCADGFAASYHSHNGSCTRCDENEVNSAQTAFMVECVALAACLLVATILYVATLTYLNRAENVPFASNVEKENPRKRNRYLHLSLHGFMKCGTSVLLSAVSFFQVFDAYTSEFSVLQGLWSFNIDPFSTILVSHACAWDPTYRQRLLIHANAPILVGIWFLFATWLVNQFSLIKYQSHNSTRGTIVALLPVVLAYPSLGRRAVGAFVCEKFETGYGSVSLLGADMRQNCESSEHHLTQFIAALYIVLYTLLVPGTFFFLYWFSEYPFSKSKIGDHHRTFNLLRRILVSPFRNSNNLHTSMSWYLGYDTIRKFLQASLIVFFWKGELAQIQASTYINFVAISFAVQCMPYRLPGANSATKIQLHLLVLICVIAGSSDVEEQLDQFRKTMILVIIALFVPSLLSLCWAYNVYVCEVALRSVELAINMQSVDEIRTACDAATELGLKPEHEYLLRVAEKTMALKDVPLFDGIKEQEKVVEVQSVAMA